MTKALCIHQNASSVADSVGNLLLQAELLAKSFVVGDHGRREAGLGDHFWQYRAFENGIDLPREIDHRRSAKQDQDFVRQLEWKTPQVLHIWVDAGTSMHFCSAGFTEKHVRASVVALAIAIAAERGGERIGLCDGVLPPARGRGQIFRLAESLSAPTKQDYVSPVGSHFVRGSSALIASDFLSDLRQIEEVLARASDQRVQGVLLQVLDPAELSFPFRGRTIFQNVLGSIEHDTLWAEDLRKPYLERLAAHQEQLKSLAAMAGWSFVCYDGNKSTLSVANKLYFLLSGGRNR